MHRWTFLAVMTLGCIHKEPVDDGAQCEGMAIICTVAGTGDAGYNLQDSEPLDTKLHTPSAVAFGRGGKLLINDSKNFLIRRLADGDDALLNTVVGKRNNTYAMPGPALDSPLKTIVDIDVGPDGILYLVESQGQQVLAVDLSRAVPTLEIIAGQPGEVGYNEEDVPVEEGLFDTLTGVAVGDDGTVYVADGETNLIRAVTPDGMLVNIAGLGEDGLPYTSQMDVPDRFDAPQRMVYLNGTLYVADSGRHRIAAVDPETGEVWDHIGTADVAGYTGDGGPVSDALLDSPFGIERTPDGRLTIADSGNHAIRSELGSGRIETVVGRGPTGYAGDEDLAENASLSFPTDLAYGPTGDLVIADTNNHVVRRVNEPNW